MAAQPQDNFVAQMNQMVQQMYPKDFKEFHPVKEEGNFNFVRQLEQLQIKKEIKHKIDNKTVTVQQEKRII